MLKKIAAVMAAAIMVFCMCIPIAAGEQLGRTNFNDGIGLPWHTCESGPALMDFEIANGVYKITVNNPGGASRGGESRWDCQFRHRGLKIVSGHTYEVKWTLEADKQGEIYAKIGNLEGDIEVWHNNAGSNFDGGWSLVQIQAGQKMTFTDSFTASQDVPVAEFAFHFGGAGEYQSNDCFPEGTTLKFSDLSLVDKTRNDNDFVTPPVYERAGVLLNQLGYFSGLSKKATFVSSGGAEGFKIYDSGNNEVYSGTTIPMGMDNDSGDNVHIINFSDFNTIGDGFYIKTDSGSSSHTFSITGGTLYGDMMYDALKYFFHNRSGIPIEAQYVGGNTQWARAAGHVSDMATTENHSDGSWAFSENMTIDVTGGWYDAGDHGKYIVNGGISVWTLQNQYERMKLLASDYAPMYADGAMNIPESGNSFPDILDEARYELEFMMKMVVPDSSQYAGMVFHKIHDEKWTGLAIAPADDPQPRIIKPPTTAATLNVSAIMAQAYRLWGDFDSSFADKCLDIAKKTYDAAKRNPARYAPLDQKSGGGAYGDDNVTDEFYWAACELYLATGDSQYYNDMQSSEYFLKCSAMLTGGEDSDTIGSMNWGNTAACGTLSLALVRGGLSDSDINTAKVNITSAADIYLEIENKQGYGIPIQQCSLFDVEITGYPWGSNSFVVNNAIIMGYAYDISKDVKYMNGVTTAMDYIMGRNAMDYSYVTGYGTHATQYPHHRFWANQIDSSFPLAPAGVLSGGPNSGLQDPWVRGSGWKLGAIAPQKAYLDHIEAWSVNECTINWNSPLVWVAGFLTQENTESVSEINIGGSGGMGKVSADTQSTGNNSNIDNNVNNNQNIINTVPTSVNAENDDNKAETTPKNNTLWIILGVIAGLISLEVFTYFFVKMLRSKP